MEYRYLGRTGLKVSALCLGAMTFGREASEADSYEILDRFMDAGGNFIDTANVYSQGVSESIVGKWLKKKNRDQFVVATKVRFSMGEGPNQIGLSRKHIMEAVNASLTRLGTDYIDLYQVHGWDAGTPLEETLHALNNLVDSGKVRYLGASNFTAWQLQKAIDTSHHNSWEPFCCLQPLYNLLDREIEWELVPVCLNEGVGIIPWSPLRGGWLSGKYHRELSGPPAGTRVEEAQKKGWSETWDAYATERTWNIIDTMKEIGKTIQKTSAQIALNWLLQQPGVTAPIIGVRTMKHLLDNLGAIDWQLSADQLDKLNHASDLPLPYPINNVKSANISRQR